MANEEHVARLKQGTAGWNEWRESHTDIQPQLTALFVWMKRPIAVTFPLTLSLRANALKLLAQQHFKEVGRIEGTG